MYEKIDKLITKVRWKALYIKDEDAKDKTSDYECLFPTK